MSKKYITSNNLSNSDISLSYTCPPSSSITTATSIGTNNTVVTPYYYTGGAVSPLDDYSVSVSDFCQYLNEQEIRDLLTTIINRAEQSVVRKIVRNLVINRHFSEEFLCDYFNYLDEHDLYVNHAANIKSGEYSRIKLLFVATE